MEEEEENKNIILRVILKEGGNLGADCFIKDKANQCSAVCMTTCELGVMDRNTL
jgi:hypothetical protein